MENKSFYIIGFGMGILFCKSFEGGRSGHVQSLADWIENANVYNRNDKWGYKTLWYFQRTKRKYINVKWSYRKLPDEEIPPYLKAAKINKSNIKRRGNFENINYCSTFNKLD